MSAPSRILRGLWLFLCLQALAACATAGAIPSETSDETTDQASTSESVPSEKNLGTQATTNEAQDKEGSSTSMPPPPSPGEEEGKPSEENLLEAQKAAFEEALSLAAKTSFQSEELPKTVEKFRALVTNEPTTASAHYNLGVLLERQGNVSLAESSYVTCLTLNRAMTPAALNLAKLYLRQQRASEGIETFSSLIVSGIPSAALHNAVAFLHLETGDLTKAIAEAKAALKVSETDHVAMITLARAFERQNKPELADLALSNASANAPASPEIANVRGVFLRSRGKTQEAMGYFKQAAEARRDFPEAHNNYGASLLAAKNYAEASEEFELALKYAPHFFEAKVNLAGALRGIGDFSGSKKIYEEILREAPEDLKADILFNLGVLHLDARNSGMDLTTQLNEAKDYLGRSNAMKKDPLIQGYLKEAEKALAREARRLKREADKKAKEEQARQQQEFQAIQEPQKVPQEESPKDTSALTENEP